MLSNTHILYLVSSIASLSLSIAAIWMSVYFYRKSKDTEKSVAVSLRGIESQTSTLSSITEKHMGQLIGSFTGLRPIEEVLVRFIENTRLEETTIDRNLTLPTNSDPNSQRGNKEISLAAKAAYYAALTNAFMQAQIHFFRDKDTSTQNNMLNKSYRDFNILKRELENIDSTTPEYESIQTVINEGSKAIKRSNEL